LMRAILQRSLFGPVPTLAITLLRRPEPHGRRRRRASARFGNIRGACRVDLCTPRLRPNGDFAMLGWALTFLILALVAGFFGFFSLAGLAAYIAKVLFLIFLVLLVVSFVMRALRGRSVV